MMGYNDEFRKLRPLVPRPPMTCSSSTPPCVARIHAPEHFFAFNHHFATMGAEQSKTFHMQPSSVVSSRWNPTPEQLRTLEELYRRGTRTPSAEQIQHITAQLRRYGKIEGKNVFYWFQNHKARERQKRRRQMECPSPQDQQYDQDNNNINMLLDRKDDNNNNNSSGGGGGGGGGSSRVAGFEVEQNNNTSTHCTTSPPEEANPRSTKAAVASAASTCRTDIHGWVQCDQRELQQQQHMMMRRRNATWHTVPATARVTPTSILSTTKTTTTSSNYQDYLNIFITHDHHLRLLHPNTNAYDCDIDRQDHDQTLELFPLRSENENGTATTPAAAFTDQKLMLTSAMDASNYQFFEFLPLKN